MKIAEAREADSCVRSSLPAQPDNALSFGVTDATSQKRGKQDNLTRWSCIYSSHVAGLVKFALCCNLLAIADTKT